MFLLNKIEKNENVYKVEIVEYLEDYSQTINEKESFIIIRDINEQEIGKVNTSEEGLIKDFVKNNIDKLSKKKIILKEIEGELYIEKVYE